MTDIIRVPRGRVEYPTADGKPMAETDLHRDLAIYVIEALKLFFAKRPNVYVSGNNFLYYLWGEQKRCISPDAYVVYGVPKHPRDCYVASEEGGKLPAAVFEFTSKSTRTEDERVKMPRYEKEMRVPEYFRFDPTGDYLSPRLQGFRLIDGRYMPLELVNGRLYSEQLGLDLVQEGKRFRLYDPVTKEWLPTTQELEAARETEKRGREAEKRGREAAEHAREAEKRGREAAEHAREVAEQARGEEIARRIAAEQAETAAQAAQATAEQARMAEETARVTAEQENGRLRAELEELRRGQARS